MHELPYFNILCKPHPKRRMIIEQRKLLMAAATVGHMIVINALVSKVKIDVRDYIMAMELAAENGQQDIVNRMIKLCTLSEDDDLARKLMSYDHAMSSAAKNGHLTIVNQMLELISDDHIFPTSECKLQIGRMRAYNSAMGSASLGGHPDIVLSLIHI